MKGIITNGNSVVIVEQKLLQERVPLPVEIQNSVKSVQQKEGQKKLKLTDFAEQDFTENGLELFRDAKMS